MKKYLTMKSLTFLVLSIFAFLPGLAFSHTMTIHMLNVETEGGNYGRSDCFIIELPTGSKMVIDCPDGGKNTLINKLTSLGYTQVKYVVGTHEHSDHIGGLDNFITEFNVNNTQIYYPYGSINSDSRNYTDLKNAAASKGMTVKKLLRGDYILNTSHDGKPVQILVMHPNKAFGDDTGAECYANEASLVLKVRYGQRSILFMGDAMNNAEHSIVDSSLVGELTGNGPVQLLKVGHHGQQCGPTPFYPCCNYFMNHAANLKFALVTCGDSNWYADTALQAYDVKYWTTGDSGYVWCQTWGDPTGWTFSKDPAWEPPVE